LVADGETPTELALMANIENKVFDNSLYSNECPEFVLHKKPCFNYGDFSHLANDYRRRVQRETTRYQKYAYESPSHIYDGHRPHGAPMRPTLRSSGHRPYGGSMRPSYRPAGHRPHGPSMNPKRPTMNGARPYKSFFIQSPLYETRPFLKSSAVKTSYKAAWVPTINRRIKFQAQQKKKMMKKSSSKPCCSKDCKKNTGSLNNKIDELKNELYEANIYRHSYKLGIDQLEGRLAEYKEREVKYIEKIRTLEMNKEFNLGKINKLTNEVETLKEDKDVVDGKLARLRKSSKDLEDIIESQRLTEYKEREEKYIVKIRTLEMYRASNLDSIKILTKELEKVKLEKDGLDSKLAGLLKASKNLDHLIESQRSDQVKEGLGYNNVPPPVADLYISPKKDLSWTGLPEFVDDTVTDYSRPSPTVVSTSAEGQNKDPFTFEDVASPNPPKPFVKFVKPKDSEPESKSKEQETPKKSQVKYVEQYRHSNKRPKGNQRN
nr:hypothetical protein [Tanacetum cinerariifolium]